MKSKNLTFFLCLLFGWLGLHRFYVGKWFTGLIQMFTLGGFYVWWAVDFLVIIFGKFRDSSGALIGANLEPQRPPAPHTGGSHEQSDTSSDIQEDLIGAKLEPQRPPAPHTGGSHEQSDTSSDIQEDWIMRAKPTAYWRFLLGANLMRAYQLDSVEKKGNQITVRVQSGRRCEFTIGEFNVKYTKTKDGNRDFTFKSTVGPKQKIVFRETLLQMPEEWWDELEKKLGVSESGIGKILGGANKVMGFLR